MPITRFYDAWILRHKRLIFDHLGKIIITLAKKQQSAGAQEYVVQ